MTQHPGDRDPTQEERELIRQSVRAGAAKTALEEFGSALDHLEREYIEAWKSTRFDDDDGRQRLWQAVQIVGKVRTHLRVLVDGGKMATKSLDEIRRMGGKRFLGVV